VKCDDVCYGIGKRYNALALMHDDWPFAFPIRGTYAGPLDPRYSNACGRSDTLASGGLEGGVMPATNDIDDIFPLSLFDAPCGSVGVSHFWLAIVQQDAQKGKFTSWYRTEHMIDELDPTSYQFKDQQSNEWRCDEVNGSDKYTVDVDKTVDWATFNQSIFNRAQVD
jgi:hypothetical protein